MIETIAIVVLAVVGYTALGLIFAGFCVSVLDWDDEGILVALYWAFWPVLLSFAAVAAALIFTWERALIHPAVWLFTLAKRFDERGETKLRLLTAGRESVAVAQSKLTYVNQRETDGTYLALCGHEFKRSVSPTCSCGPCPF